MLFLDQTSLFTPFRKLASNPLIHAFAKANSTSFSHSLHQRQGTAVGWGYKNSGCLAKYHHPAPDFLLMEDGFVRSLFPGNKYGTTYSIVADSRGIYYDASGESDLTYFLNGEIPAPAFWGEPQDPLEIEAVLHAYREAGVSKYNCCLPQSHSLPQGVLVVDQTKGDAAIKHGGCELTDFDRMLKDALREHPEDTIYVKTHPDHHYRKKKSCFSQDLLQHPRVHILPNDFCLTDTLSISKKVYVATSLLGMEALIHGVPVVTYGWNFFSGWGLTEDRASSTKPPRTKQLTLEQLFEAAYLRYTLYYDPNTKEPTSLLEIIKHIQLQHQQWSKHSEQFSIEQLSPWKIHVLPKFTFPHKPEQTNPSKVYTWGKKEISTNNAKEIVRIEDGFIRSRGLGANFNFPLSWVFDSEGIYFDATRPSALERVLQEHQFTEAELDQAKTLITYLKDAKITKYNLGIETSVIPQDAKGKKVILIPGQVDSDASITYGSPKLKNNRELVSKVKELNPDAYICYKPHPDLLAGARPDAPLWEGMEKDIDHVITKGDIISWIQVVDEVHTLTSTVGFEALLHDKPVLTYGMPFYAGWGLTKDSMVCERRTRKLNLEELAVGVYLKYPTYLNPLTEEFTTALATAKLLNSKDFLVDSRPTFLRIIGDLKSAYNRKRRK